MKRVHVNDLNGLLVEFKNDLVLISVGANDEGNLAFDFVDPFTDQDIELTDAEARSILKALMFDPFAVGGANE
ncbi:hypothetical protein [Aeromonas veronii]|uniref:hypothetical protein n=1 Tax=Aeromonas veronii TaxID=654 RepID=UPI003B9F9D0C